MVKLMVLLKEKLVNAFMKNWKLLIDFLHMKEKSDHLSKGKQI